MANNSTLITHLQKGVVFTPTPFTMAPTMVETMATQFHPYHPFAKGCDVLHQPLLQWHHNGTTKWSKYIISIIQYDTNTITG
jgi:hypothetical protein